MNVQKIAFNGLNNKVFASHSKKESDTQKKVFYDIDSVDTALMTDSIDDPILPQVIRKLKKSYNILFPAKVINEAKNIKTQIDDYVDGKNFQAVA